MKKLNEKDWKPSEIQDIFSISSGVRLESRNRSLGSRPFVGALDNSNGVVQFVDDTNASLDHNVLGVNYNGNGMGIGFYHPYECIFSDDVKRFHLKDVDDTLETLLFSKTLIEKQRDKFGYLYKFNANRMAATSIMLPVSDSGKPDYQYMAEYVQTHRNAMLAKYRIYIEKRIAEIGEYVEIPALNQKKWAAVRLTDVFDMVSRGKRLKKADHIEGDMPYISSTARTNGNDGTCGNEVGVRVFEHCLTLANSGSVGSCFYHPYQFVASDHVTALQRSGMSEFAYLALSALVRRLGEKYNFNREINDARISRERIMLPVTDSGEPDYEYMEQYIKNMMLQKYRQYLTFIDGKRK